MTVQIEKQIYIETLFEKKIIKAFKKLSIPSSIYDIVVATALPTEWVEFAIRKLLSKYPCRFIVSQKQDLLYVFDFSGKSSFLDKIKKTILNNVLIQKHKKLHRLSAFLLGELKKQKEALFMEKIILNYIRNNKGRIIIAELIQLTGWGIRTAETEIVQLMINYNGEVEVTEEGVLIYHFESLAKDDDAASDLMDSLKIWERPTPEKEIGLSAQLNYKQIFYPSASIGMFFTAFLGYGSMNIEYSLSLFTLSTLLVIPSLRNIFLLLRFAKNYKDNEKIRMQNVEKYILKAILSRLETQINPDKEIIMILDSVKPVKNYSYWWSEKIMPIMYDIMMMLTCTYHKEAIFQKKALELEAEMSEDDEGNIYYEFERLQRELNILKKIHSD